MSLEGFNEGVMPDAVRDRLMSVQFSNLVMQNTNMTLLFLGQVPHPDSGECLRDIEAAKMFIDQLEMLEFKTRGNLTAEEDQLLQRSLMHLRLAFVQAVENPPAPDAPGQKAETPAAPAAPPAPAAADAGADESRKRFSKKF